MKKPLRVYLDSSDYSNLSNKNDTQHTDCLRQLKDFSRAKKVDFVFSAFVISEMVALDFESINAAKLRIKLMNELCSYSVTGFNELTKLEVNNLYRACPIHIFRKKELWIPESIVPLKQFKIKTSAYHNKQQFNDLAARHSKENNVPLFISKIDLGMQYDFFDQDEATSLLLNEMRNIDFLIDIIDYKFEFSQHLSDLVRESSGKFTNSIEGIIDDNPELTYSNDEWISKANNFILNFIKNVYIKERPNSDFPFSISEVMRTCPGLFTGMLSSRLAVRDSFAVKNRRKMKSSDLVDSMHSVYAPYVDIFRADKYMTRHVRQAGASNVVENLLDLPDVIRQRLEII